MKPLAGESGLKVEEELQTVPFNSKRYAISSNAEEIFLFDFKNQTYCRQITNFTLLKVVSYKGKIICLTNTAKPIICDFNEEKFAEKIAKNYLNFLRARNHPDRYSIRMIQFSTKLYYCYYNRSSRGEPRNYSFIINLKSS